MQTAPLPGGARRPQKPARTTPSHSLAPVRSNTRLPAPQQPARQQAQHGLSWEAVSEAGPMLALAPALAGLTQLTRLVAQLPEDARAARVLSRHLPESLRQLQLDALGSGMFDSTAQRPVTVDGEPCLALQRLTCLTRLDCFNVCMDGGVCLPPSVCALRKGDVCDMAPLRR